MLDLYGILKVNDSTTGELIEKVDGVMRIDDIDNAESVTDEDKNEFANNLKEQLHPDTLTGDYVVRVDIVVLKDEYTEENV